jgi:hypothetical protein
MAANELGPERDRVEKEPKIIPNKLSINPR